MIEPATYLRLREVAEVAIQAEWAARIRLRDEGRMSDDALRTIERELNLDLDMDLDPAESRYQSARIG